MGNRKLITYVLVTILILILPALTGFLQQYFIPYIYIALQLLYLLLGYYHLKAIDLFCLILCRNLSNMRLYLL